MRETRKKEDFANVLVRALVRVLCWDLFKNLADNNSLIGSCNLSRIKPFLDEHRDDGCWRLKTTSERRQHIKKREGKGWCIRTGGSKSS